MSIYDQFGVPVVINAAGPVTRYGGSCLSQKVLDAMAQATREYVRLDELQIAVGKKLAALTNTEAGYVTTGAAAGLTLGAAALMAGLDPERMARLPETEHVPDEFILQTFHRGDYDCAVRAAGGRLVGLDCEATASVEDVRYLLESLRTPRTCATVYVFRTGDRGVPLDTWVKASHAAGFPVLVDASVRLPPAENLRAIPGSGADLVAFSGGKAVGGPQGSGFVVGKKDLIDSVLLQNQDLDVNAETWFLRDWIREGKLSKPPGMGIGRGFKVSKETIVGLWIALEEYLERDHATDLATWHERVDFIAEGLGEESACRIEKAFDEKSSYPIPMGILRLTDSSPERLAEFVNRCASLDRPVLFEEGTLSKGYLVVHPMCLSEEDAAALVAGVKRSLPIAEGP